MVNISNSNFIEHVMADEREFLLKVRIGAESEVNNGLGRVLTGKNEIVSMTLEECAEAQDYQSLGNFCSSKLTIVLYDSDDQRDYYEGCTVCAYCGVRTAYTYDDVNEADYEMVPLGTFFVTDVVKPEGNLGKVTLTAYDKACFLEDIFSVTTEELLAFAGEDTEDIDIALVTHYIVYNKGISLANDNLPIVPISLLPSGLTYRQMLGYIAGLMGCNVKFNRLNQLEFYWYKDVAYEIEPDQQYYGEFLPKLKSERKATSLLCICGEQTLSKGNGEAGTCIQVENPLMTETAMDNIWNQRFKRVFFDTSALEMAGFSPHLIYSGQKENIGVSAVYSEADGTFIYSGLIDADGLETSGDYAEYLFPYGVYRVESDNQNLLVDKHMVVTEISESNGNTIFQFMLTESEPSEPIYEDGQTITIYRIRQWIAGTDVITSYFTEDEKVQIFTDLALGSSMLHKQIAHTRYYPVSTEEYFLISDLNGTIVCGEYEGQQIACAKEKSSIDKISYIPAELKWRGNPALEIGDIVEVVVGTTSYHLYVMEQTLQMSGGIYSKIICKGETEVASNFSSSANNGVGVKIDKVYNTLQESISEATESIAGQSGGNVLIRKREDNVTELFVFDGETLEASEHVWRWNAAGLGFSGNGYEGPFEIAITAEGKIHAERLVGGSIDGGTLHIGMDDIQTIIETINNNIGQGCEPISAAAIKVGETGETLDKVIALDAYKGGGSNLLSNSSGLFELKGWDLTGEVNTETDIHGLISGKCFSFNASAELISNEIYSVPLIPEAEYTLAARAKGGGSGFVQVENEDGSVIWGKFLIDGSETEWTMKHITFFAEPNTNMNCRVRMHCDSGAMAIGDLILRNGTQTLWSPHPGEMYGSTVQISPFGLSVEQVESKTKTVINAEGTSVYSTEKDERVAMYTSDGVQTKKLVTKEQISAGKTRIIPRDEENMIIWVINDDTEVKL